MVSLVVLIIFFWILVLFYPALLMIISTVGWLMKKCGIVAANQDAENLRCNKIDLGTDHLKEITFQISVWLVFFIGAPFCMYWLYVGFD